MSKIRNNSDIKYVIIQHTGDANTVSFNELADFHSSQGDFGPPYDIIIDIVGNIALTPRWTRSLKRDSLEVLLDYSKIMQYKEHFENDIIPIYYRNNSIIIGVIGDFDNERPNNFIFNTLQKVLSEIVTNIDIDLYTGLLYYNEIYTTSSPGVFFFDKIQLIKSVVKKQKNKFVPFIYEKNPSGDGGGIVVEEESEVTSALLTEDGKVMLNENETYIKLES